MKKCLLLSCLSILLLFQFKAVSSNDTIQYFQPYNSKNSKSYKVYHPSDIVEDKNIPGARFQCTKIVGNNQALPTFPNFNPTSYWKMYKHYRPGTGPNPPNFQKWNGSYTVSYSAGDYVKYNGSTYKCVKKVNNSVLPPNAPANWKFVSQPHSLFVAQMGISEFPILNKNESNFKYFSPDSNDIVSYKGKLYKCIREVSNTITPDVNSEFWRLYEATNNQSNKNVAIILVNQNSFRIPIILKIYNTAKLLGYNPFLLTDNIIPPSSTNESNTFTNGAIQYYTNAGFTNFKNLVDKNIFVSSPMNIINIINKYQPKYIYYLGDGECTSEGECPYISGYGSNLSPSNIKNINFAKNSTFVANACHGANAPFGLAIYNAGVENYAAGVTYLLGNSATLVGLGVFTNVLLGLEIDDAFLKTSTKLESLYKKYQTIFANGSWGYYSNRKNFYNFQLYNYSSSNQNYHNNLFSNFEPIHINKKSGDKFTNKTWPLKADGQVIISNPILGPQLHTSEVKMIE